MAKIRDWNFVANVADGALFSLAMSLVSQQTILPVFVKRIGGGNIALGLIPVLWAFGFNFPQIAVANFVQGYQRKKILLLKTALGQRIPWLLLAVASYAMLDRVGTPLSLFLFFTLYALAAVGGSVNFPVWFDLIATLTPVHARGRLFAARSILGSLLGIIGGGVATYVLAMVSFPSSFALLFLLAFGMMMASYAFLGSLKEDGRHLDSPIRREGRLLRGLIGILRGQKNYRNFLIADALYLTSTMANAFYTIYAFQKFSLSDEFAGTFTIAMMASMIGGSWVFGYLADRWGHKLNLLISGMATVSACVTALAAPSVEAYMAVFVFSAWAVALAGISRFSIVAELCTEAERPTYIALTNLVTSPCILFGILAGAVADQWGYAIVFIAAGFFALASVFWMWFRVQEPRWAVAVAPVKEVV